MIQIKTRAEVEKMRAAGLVVARALQKLQDAVEPGISTADLDAISAESIRGDGAVPSFLGYHGFPATICASISSASEMPPTRRSYRTLRAGRCSRSA